MYQHRSRVKHLKFAPERRIAQIFFGTNDRSLDRRDRAVIQEVAMMTISELGKGKPVELTLLAECDSRGSEAYNRWLSDQRLKVVADSLARAPLLYRMLNWVWGVSAGEELYFAKSQDRNRLARHRCVSIFWGNIEADLSLLRQVHRLDNLPEPARYDMKKGFAQRISPAMVRHERLCGMWPIATEAAADGWVTA